MRLVCVAGRARGGFWVQGRCLTEGWRSKSMFCWFEEKYFSLLWQSLSAVFVLWQEDAYESIPIAMRPSLIPLHSSSRAFILCTSPLSVNTLPTPTLPNSLPSPHPPIPITALTRPAQSKSVSSPSAPRRPCSSVRSRSRPRNGLRRSFPSCARSSGCGMSRASCAMSIAFSRPGWMRGLGGCGR